MNGSYLGDLFEKAKNEGLAIQIESFFFDNETIYIEPEDEYKFSAGGRVVIINDEIVVDLKHVALVKLVPSEEERDKKEREMWENLMKKHMEGENETVF